MGAPSFLLASCVYCDEPHPSALTRRGQEFVCACCADLERGRPSSVCGLCGGLRPTQWDHVVGKANSPVMMEACCNCHRVRHAMERL